MPTRDKFVGEAKTQELTNKTIGTTNLISFNSPEGFLINGKIVPSVASNNLTVAIKTMSGDDASASNPIYIRISGITHTITAALSVTKNAGTNWFNAGATEHATKAIDYFVYLGYNTTDGVVVGFSRIPYVAQYDGFSTSTTNDKYAGISTITNASATNSYVIIGRFTATLSAGAGYTWTVPTFTPRNLIQRPIYESGSLSWTPVFTYNGTAPSTLAGTHIFYIVKGRTVIFNQWQQYSSAGSGNTSITMTLPFGITSPYNSQYCSVSAHVLSGSTNNVKYAQFNATGAANYGDVTFTLNSTAVNSISSSGEYLII